MRPPVKVASPVSSVIGMIRSKAVAIYDIRIIGSLSKLSNVSHPTGPS